MIDLDYTVASRKVNNKIKKRIEYQTWLNYENLTPADKIHVKSQFGGFVGKTGSLGLSTNNPDDQNDPKTMNIINSYKFLESTKHYNMPDLDSLLIDLVSASKDHFSQAEEQNIDKSTDELWLKFMKDIQNPETQLLLKSIGQYTLSNSTFGWQLASSNLMRIRAQMPSATFVQTRRQWHDKYRRRVLPNAQKIGVIVPINKSSYRNLDDKKNIMKQYGYNDDVSYNDLSVQQKDFIDVTSVAGEGVAFRLMVYYDVSQTELIDPNGEDIWNDTVGFDNNMTGHLNKAAIRSKANSYNGDEDLVQKLYNNENGNIQLLTKALAQGISERYPDISTSLPLGNNEHAYEKCYHDMIERLADKLIEEKCKIVKKENREQGITIVTTIVLCLTKVSPTIVATKLANNELTEDSYFELRTIINTITLLIRKYLPKNESNKLIYEMEIPILNSVDELLNMIGMDRSQVKPTPKTTSENTIQEIKENFYQYLNRLNQ